MTGTHFGGLTDREMIFVHDAYIINVVRVHFPSSIVNHFQFLDHSWPFLENYHVFDRLPSHSHQPGQCILCPSCITNPVLEELLAGQDLYFHAAFSPTCFNFLRRRCHIQIVSSHDQALFSRIVTRSVQVWNNAELRFKNGPQHCETSQSDSLNTNISDSGFSFNVSKPLSLLKIGLTCPPRSNIGQAPTSGFSCCSHDDTRQQEDE